jgi:hypothetical protein
MQQHSRFNLSTNFLRTADLSFAKLKSQPTNAVRNFGGRFGGALIMVVVSLSDSDVDFVSNFCRGTFSYLSLSPAILQSSSLVIPPSESSILRNAHRTGTYKPYFPFAVLGFSARHCRD